MQIVPCPSCGAQVQFRSHASVMAVCEFCRTTVLKDAASVGAQGKLSDVLEDYSPIQVGTSGVVGGRNFNVVGRIQLRYDSGFWNEWFIVFDDGASGWLGDASGQYSLTIEREAEGALPAFDEVSPGRLYTVNGERYTAADKHVAKCIGGQGELPFKVGDGWEKMTLVREKVAVKGEKEREVELRYTRHGPVLFQDAKRHRAYALKWVGHEPGGAAYLASLSVDRARNQKEFLKAILSRRQF